MITVKLTPTEAWAYEQYGAMTEREARDFSFLQMVAQGVVQDEATSTAEALAQALTSSKQKIEEARRFEIQIVK